MTRLATIVTSNVLLQLHNEKNIPTVQRTRNYLNVLLEMVKHFTQANAMKARRMKSSRPEGPSAIIQGQEGPS